MQVTKSESVRIALRTLGEQDRRRVEAWLDHLGNWENDEFVRAQSHRLPSDGNTYVLGTGSDLRVFFTVTKDGIVILDVARKAALQGFAGAADQSTL